MNLHEQRRVVAAQRRPFAVLGRAESTANADFRFVTCSDPVAAGIGGDGDADQHLPVYSSWSASAYWPGTDHRQPGQVLYPHRLAGPPEKDLASAPAGPGPADG
jgi:hypothetical protein